jgi:molybdenum cofactor cytidylyltransferase
VIAGILLAAGEGRRFGGSGKLQSPLPDGTQVGLSAARHLAGGGLDRCVAVVRPTDAGLARLFRRAGLEVLACSESRRGMGASLAAAVAETAEADGWLVALGDMPWVAPATVAAVADALRCGAALAAPWYGGRGGHPVGFAGELGPELRRLDGDTGARRVVDAHRHRLVRVAVDDPGVLRDVDGPADLERGATPG